MENNLEMYLELKINGALIMPTEEQWKRIKDFAYSQVFITPETPFAAKKGRPAGSKNKSRARNLWTPAEDNLVSTLRASGASFKQIAKRLKTDLGTTRTKHGVQIRYSRVLTPRLTAAAPQPVFTPTVNVYDNTPQNIENSGV